MLHSSQRTSVSQTTEKIGDSISHRNHIRFGGYVRIILPLYQLDSSPPKKEGYIFAPGKLITDALFGVGFQNAAESPARAMKVAIAGTQALTLQLSAKYQKPKRSRNGTTMAAAVHSCVRIWASICGWPKIVVTTITA